MYKAGVLSAPGIVAVDQTSASVDLKRPIANAAVGLTVTDDAPAVKTFIDGDIHVVNNTITEVAHGYKTGLKVALTTSGVLPTGLSATNYYVIRVDADTFKLASSVANASAGTAVDITAAAGGGTHTLTPAALSASLLLQMSMDDGTSWFTIDTTAITATGSYLAEYTAPPFGYLRGVLSIAAGQVDVSAMYLGANDSLC